MSLKCGIVGLPNVGKSTLFNALTSASIDAENFPFCTIEPNQGIVPVPDDRLNFISSLVNPLSTIPTTTEFVDIAGLVKGASKGEGLGNQFLSHIRETQAIIHVVRCFEDKNILHVHEEIDPKVGITSFHHVDGQNLNFAYPAEEIKPLLKEGVIIPFYQLQRSNLEAQKSPDVFVTRSGRKYHHSNCHYLR